MAAQEGQAKESSAATTDETAGEARSGHDRGLHKRILFGLVLGAAIGLVANYTCSRTAPAAGAVDPLDQNGNSLDDRLDWFVQNLADPIGRVFLRLMFMIVVPLVFSALALGVIEIGDVRRLGRIGVRTLLFAAVLSGSAVALGLILVNVLRPGGSLPEAQRTALRTQYAASVAQAVENAEKAKPLRDAILDIIPENPLQEMVGALDGSSKGNGMLAVMFFALVVGIAATTVGEQTRTFVGWLEGLYAISMAIIAFAMRLAPVGVGCLVFAITARLGVDVLQTLFWFVATVVLGLAIQLFVVYGVLLRTMSGMGPRRFYRGVSDAMITAFATSSSSATLPTALRVAEEGLRLPAKVARFVLTVGATGNQNGTALYEGVVVLFLAQVFGVELSPVQQMTVVLMSVLAGIGTAGVPGGSLPLIVVLLRTVGVPGEGIGIILGVDRLLDMCRTVVNVTGDLAIAACVAKGHDES